MENENPTHNQEVLKDGKEISVLKDFYTTQDAPPHTLRKRILTDVNEALSYSLKDRFDSFVHYLLIISFIVLILFFNAINYSPPQPQHLIRNRVQTDMPQAFSLPRRTADIENLSLDSLLFK